MVPLPSLTTCSLAVDLGGGGRRHCLALAAPERPWWLRDAGAVMTLQPWEGRRERECGLAMITSGVRQALCTGERRKQATVKQGQRAFYSAVEQGREALHLFVLVGYRRFECLRFEEMDFKSFVYHNRESFAERWIEELASVGAKCRHRVNTSIWTSSVSTALPKGLQSWLDHGRLMPPFSF